MPRDVGNSDVVTVLNSGEIKTAYLFEARLFDTANNLEEKIYATDNHYDLRHNDNYYYALGYFLTVQGIEEFNDSRIASVTVQLSGVDSSLIGSVLSYEYLDRYCCIKRVFLTEQKTSITSSASTQSPQIIDQPVTIFEGTIESPVIRESASQGQITVQLSASSRFSEFTLKSGRHTNPEEQRFYDSGDKLFDMVGKIDPNLVWGQDA